MRLKTNAKVVTDFAKTTALEYCPICKTAYDSTLKINVENLRSAWAALTTHSKVSFQINADTLSSEQ